MKHEIRLYGPIGGWFGYTAEEIINGIPENASEITLRIHSPGGSVGEGLAIYHALKDHPASVTTIVDGYAASSASFVMLAGDERLVHRNSIVFVHNPWAYAEGNAEELRKTAEGLDVHRDAILDIYKQETGQSEEELKNMMDETAFFRGVDAKENGFATGIIDDAEEEAQIAAMLKFEGMTAKTEEKRVMSRQKTRKEIEDEATEIVAERDAAKAELESVKAELETIKTQSKSEIDELTKQLAEKQAEADNFKAEAEAAATELETVNESVSEKDKEIGKLKAQLKDPAYDDAALKEAEAAKIAAEDAEALAAEEKAKAEAEKSDKNKSYGDIAEEYEAIEDADKRREFLAKNKRAIMAAYDAR